MNKKQTTEVQHIVPKFYLKKFANTSGFVEVFDIEKVKISTRPRSYSSVCYGKFFYAQQTGQQDDISQDMEDLFASMEDKFAKNYDSIISAINSTRALSSDEMVWLASLMSMLWLRSERMRDQINRMIINATKDIMALTASMGKDPAQTLQKQLETRGKRINKAEAKETIKMLVGKDYDLNVDNLHHLRMIGDIVGFRNIFLAKKWRIYTAPTEYKFITSDTPVIEEFPKGTGFYGPDIGQRTHYLTLMPNILIELTDPGKPGKHVKRKTITAEEVINFNYKRLGWSYKYAYSSNKEEFEKILTTLDKIEQLKSETLRKMIYLSKTRE